MAKISFNGQEYDSIDAMPSDVRKIYEQMQSMFVDTDNDGVPDLLQGDVIRQHVTSVSQFIVDGKTYSRLEDLPPDARDRYTAAMAKFDTNRNGIPDILEGGLMTSATSNSPPAAPISPINSIPTVKVVGDQPDSGTMRLLVIGLVVLVLVALIAYFLGASMTGR